MAVLFLLRGILLQSWLSVYSRALRGSASHENSDHGLGGALLPYINKFTFGLLNAYALKAANQGYEVAVLMSRQGHHLDAPVLEASGMHQTGLANWSTRTAIVNAIQRRAAMGNLGNLVVFATYQPTVACIGMMKTHGLHSVSYVQNNQSRYMQINNVANVAHMAGGNLPGTQNPYRTQVPGNALPNALEVDPSANFQGTTAQTYLAALAQINHQHINGWRASFPGGPPAGPRMFAGLRRFAGASTNASQAFADLVYMLFIISLAGQVQWPGTQSGARIVGLLASRSGQIYGWQLNQRHINTTYHAETNLIQGLGLPIPQGATLYTTLEPCHQCAGLYVRAGGQRCVYAQNDPNMTGNTALGNNAILFNRATYRDTSNLPDLTFSERLDDIRDFSTVAKQAARVAQLRQQNQNLTIPQASGQVGNIQARVLDILNTAPARGLYAQSRRVLTAFAQIERGRHMVGTPERQIIENVGTVLNI